jgi:hypothetical protein
MFTELDQVAEHAGTLTVSPLDAEFIADCTSALAHETALTVPACALETHKKTQNKKEGGNQFLRVI